MGSRRDPDRHHDHIWFQTFVVLIKDVVGLLIKERRRGIWISTLLSIVCVIVASEGIVSGRRIVIVGRCWRS